MRPRTRHINVKYHHFREAVAQGRITIEHVSTTNQLADGLTKNLPYTYTNICMNVMRSMVTVVSS
jgi:hypothetical protein